MKKLIFYLLVACMFFYLITLPFFLIGQNSVLFPANAADLPANTYWRIQSDHGGSNARDLEVRRLTSNGSSRYKEGTSGNQNQDHLIYGTSVYAPTDGEIVACWCNSPENPVPGTPNINRCCDGDCKTSCDDGNCPSSFPCRIARSGNYVVILTKDNTVILLAHLKPGSIPENLCPYKNIYFQNARNKTAGLPNESIVPINQRKKVKAGDLVGRVGNSGASSGPHLHIHTMNVTVSANGTITNSSKTIPTLYRNAWISENNGTSWKKLKDQALATPPILIQSSPFLRRDDDDAGNFNEISLDGSVAAVSNSQGNLQIIAYGVYSNGVLKRVDSEEAGKATNVCMIHPKPESANAMTAVRTSSGNLKVIAWQISSNGGQIVRKGEKEGGPVTDIAVSRFPDGNGCFTAVKLANESMKLIAWEMKPDLSVSRHGEIGAGKVNNLNVTTTLVDFKGAITATTGEDNKLKVIAWQFNGQAKTFTRRGDNSAGVTSGKLQITRAPISNKDIVVTACKDEYGQLKLIAWEISASGQVTRKGSASAGIFELTDMTSGQNGNIITTLKDNSGNLRMIAWKVDANGKIEYSGKENAGAIDKLSSSYIYRDGKEFLLTAVRSSPNNKLRMVCWEANLK